MIRIQNKAFRMAVQLAAVASMMGAGAAHAALSSYDAKILKDMAGANIAEVEAGKVALSKSQDGEVKTFAQKMIDDHTKSLEEVKQLANAKGVKLPTHPDAKHKAAQKKLAALSGIAFDKAYMKQGGVADHTKVHHKLEEAKVKTTDPDVKALVTKTVDVVGQHLTSAKQIEATVAKK